MFSPRTTVELDTGALFYRKEKLHSFSLANNHHQL